MKILFLLSSLEPAGSETYCLTLANFWQGRHEVFWISDALHFGQTYTAMPISQKAIPGGILNTLRVAWFIRKHGIQIIHSHSRRAHWVAAQAARLTGIAHVTTIHQQLPVHFFSKHFPCLGDATIVIDEVVAEHTRSNFPRARGHVYLVRNGIPLTDCSPSLRDNPGQKKVLVIGRLTGGRWNALQFFLTLLETAPLPPALYHIVGRVPDARRSALLKQLSLLNSRIAPARVELLGFVNELRVTIRNADAVLAAGRSAMESLANARPVIVLGEGGTLGLCQPAAWPMILRTNFADHLSPPQFDAVKLEHALRDVLMARGTHDLARWGREQIEIHYDLAKMAPQIETIYAQVNQ